MPAHAEGDHALQENCIQFMSECTISLPHLNLVVWPELLRLVNGDVGCIVRQDASIMVDFTVQVELIEVAWGS